MQSELGTSSEFKKQQIDFLVLQNGKLYDQMSLIEADIKTSALELTEIIGCNDALNGRLRSCISTRNGMQEDLDRLMGLKASIHVCEPYLP